MTKLTRPSEDCFKSIVTEGPSLYWVNGFNLSSWIDCVFFSDNHLQPEIKFTKYGVLELEKKLKLS